MACKVLSSQNQTFPTILSYTTYFLYNSWIIIILKFVNIPTYFLLPSIIPFLPFLSTFFPPFFLPLPSLPSFFFPPSIPFFLKLIDFIFKAVLGLQENEQKIPSFCIPPQSPSPLSFLLFLTSFICVVNWLHLISQSLTHYYIL